MAGYDIYPGVDETYAFPPEIRAKAATSPEINARFTALATQGTFKKFATLADLIASTGLGENDIASVGRYAFSSGIIHRESLWQFVNGTWVPLADIMGEAANGAGLLSVGASIVTLFTPNSGKILLPQGTIVTNVLDGKQIRWDGSNWAPLGIIMLRRWAQWNNGPAPRSNWWDVPIDSWEDPFNLGVGSTGQFKTPATGRYRVLGQFGYQQDTVERVMACMSPIDATHGEVEKWSGLPKGMVGNTAYPFQIIFRSYAGVNWKLRVYHSEQTDLYMIAGGTNGTELANTSEFTLEYLGS